VADGLLDGGVLPVLKHMPGHGRATADSHFDLPQVDADPEALNAELVKMIREKIGPIACFKQSNIVARLPKTRSGKILRGTMRKIADGADFKVPSTIDDPAILGEIEEKLKEIGYAKK